MSWTNFHRAWCGLRVSSLRIKLTFSHAVVNVVVFLINLYGWSVRRDTETNVNPAKVPTTINVVSALVMLPLLVSSAKAGGSLTYNHGVGLKLGRKSGKEVNRKPGQENIIDKVD